MAESDPLIPPVMPSCRELVDANTPLLQEVQVKDVGAISESFDREKKGKDCLS